MYIFIYITNGPPETPCQFIFSLKVHKTVHIPPSFTKHRNLKIY